MGLAPMIAANEWDSGGISCLTLRNAASAVTPSVRSGWSPNVGCGSPPISHAVARGFARLRACAAHDADPSSGRMVMRTNTAFLAPEEPHVLNLLMLATGQMTLVFPRHAKATERVPRDKGAFAWVRRALPRDVAPKASMIRARMVLR